MVCERSSRFLLWACVLACVSTFGVGCDDEAQAESLRDPDAGEPLPDAATTRDAANLDAEIAPGLDGSSVVDANGDAADSVDVDEDAGIYDDAGIDEGTIEPKSLEIEGTWQSSYGTESIASDLWGDRSVVSYDNAANYAITQNPADAMYGPSKFNKVAWTEIQDGGFYYCWVDFSRDTAEEARDTTNTADASDPANGGCGGFSWTRLDAQ